MSPTFDPDTVLRSYATERGRLVLLDWSRLPETGQPCASRNVVLVGAEDRVLWIVEGTGFEPHRDAFVDATFAGGRWILSAFVGGRYALDLADGSIACVGYGK